jgi:NADH-quinone oxidoreductase subunit G
MVEVQSPRGTLTARLKLSPHFPRGVVFIPENYRILRLNGLMRAGEYPCPVKVRKARATMAAASAAAQPA